MSDDTSAALLGKTLGGRYRIERLLGEGGMGAVYQAEHMLMHKRVAIKILHPDMNIQPEVVARFEREAMAAAHIDHPNIAAATDFGKTDDGHFFLVLEFVEGTSLRDLIHREAPLAAARVFRIVRQIASALQRAHGMGIVHRDLKPENVMLVDREGESDFVKVLDFGIAKVPVNELSGSANNGAVLTQLGVVYGTPEYMAPEQASGHEVDARADLYALGVIAYEMLCGVRPFEHESKVALMGMHVTAVVPPMAETAPAIAVPAEVEALVMTLLAKKAANRFADSRSLIEAIDGIVGTGASSSSSLQKLPISRSSPTSAAKIALRPSVVSPLPVISAKPRRPPSVMVVGALALVAGVALALGFFFFRRHIPASSVTAEKAASSVPAPGTPNVPGSPAGEAASGTGAPIEDGGVADGGDDDDDAGDDDVDPDTQAPVEGPKSLPVLAPTNDADADKAVVQAAALLSRGDAPGAVALLQPIEAKSPARVDVHRLLARAHETKGSPREALREIDLWLKLEPAAARYPKLVATVRSAARTKESQDAAFALLQSSRMGNAGPDILYDLAYGRTAMARARASLGRGDVRAHASPALLVALDLRRAGSCAGKHALMPRARDYGDRRALALLRPLQATSGCGGMTGDCWLCLRRDSAFTHAINAIEARKH